ncbi:MAG: sigma-70 family RNA polymerase sigma factor [Vicinamibacterales bacterium]|nr:sigma-70 family RNA polymerase sigma factor [Vicinamibacterales bacterium]
MAGRRDEPAAPSRAAEPAPVLDDAALLQAARAGDAEAFGGLVERHRRTVYNVCYRFTGNHEDASDLAQDVFVRAYRGLAAFRGDAAVSTWLYRIAVNVCLNRAAVKRPSLEPLDGRRLVDHATEAPDRAVLREERAARVRAALTRLPPRQRMTVVLRTYHDLTHEQIASMLGSSVGTVKANFFHALRNLRVLLGGPEAP